MKPYWQRSDDNEPVKKDNIGCGCLILIILFIIFAFPILDLTISYFYVKGNNAPKGCIFAIDTVTCVQISKKEQQ